MLNWITMPAVREEDCARPLLDLHKVSKRYHSLSGEVLALKGIDLQVTAGEFVVVTGKSGSGKTTLVNMITGLDRLSSGEVWVAGAAMHRMSMEQTSMWRGRVMGIVFQTFELLPSLTIQQNVMLPMDFAHRYSLEQQRQRALDLLEQVGIGEHAYKRPGQISGGQQQRVAVARALANDPAVIIADEPTGSLDSGTSHIVVEIFERLASQGKLVLLVTHDRDIARRASRAITLADGEVVDERRS